MSEPRGRCTNTHLGCTCKGDTAIHDERAQQISDARTQAGEGVECPECGGPTTPLSIVTWGNCRACRTAQSRQIHPLRW